MNASEFNLHQIPPGGWQFFQPQTGWSAPSPVAFTFEQQATNIVRHRLSNLAIAQRHKLATDFNSVANELENYTRKRLGIVEVPPPKTVASPGAPRPAGAVVAGVKTLYQWLGDGGLPVAPELAEQRAATCVQCPHNNKGDWTRWFTNPASELIRKQLAVRHDMGLKTGMDDQLEICEVCACPLKLKVHAPVDVIQKYIPENVKANLPAWCWIKNEHQP